MPETPPHGQGPGTDLAERVTLPLLTLISRQALDEDYVAAAERRSAGDQRPRRGRGYIAVVAIVLFGVLASTAAVQRSRDAEVNDAGRTTLISRITEERERVSLLQDRVVELRQANAASQERFARTVDAAESATNEVRQLRLSTGFVAVTGPGVLVTLDDGPEEVVFDSNLALLINGLWSAGAEAISVNGQRITARTAIRNSGPPILINGVGVAPPYKVSAIGDRRTLQANFFDTSSGLAFADLADRLGFVDDFSNESDLSLPSGPDEYLRLRRVQVATNEPVPNRGETSP